MITKCTLTLSSYPTTQIFQKQCILYRATAKQTGDCGREGGTCGSDCHPRASRMDPHRPLQPPVHGDYSCTPTEGQFHQRKQGTFIQTPQGCHSQCQKNCTVSFGLFSIKKIY